MRINLSSSRMGDYEYYEEPQPVPTFSDGSSSGGRAAKSKAAASRAVASKSALSAASRASAMMAASIQQLPKNSIITANGIRSTQINRPSINVAAVQAAQKRADIVMKTAKPPEQLLIKLPAPDVIHKMPESTTIIQGESDKKIQEDNIHSKTAILELYSLHVEEVRKKKQELLLSFTPVTLEPKKSYYCTRDIRHKTLTEDRPVHQEALTVLSRRLSSLIGLSDKTAMLDEIDAYQTTLRISIEEPLHKAAIQNAHTNKQAYLTSDA